MAYRLRNKGVLIECFMNNIKYRILKLTVYRVVTERSLSSGKGRVRFSSEHCYNRFFYILLASNWVSEVCVFVGLPAPGLSTRLG